MTITFSPRTGVSGILQDGVEVVTIGATGITAGIPAATTAEIQAGTITNKFVTPATAGALALGVGQTWQDVTGSRVSGTTYYNTTGKPIQLDVIATNPGTHSNFIITINGVSLGSVYAGAVASHDNRNTIVPNGQSYLLTTSGSFFQWSELR